MIFLHFVPTARPLERYRVSTQHTTHSGCYDWGVCRFVFAPYCIAAYLFGERYTFYCGEEFPWHYVFSHVCNVHLPTTEDFYGLVYVISTLNEFS